MNRVEVKASYRSDSICDKKMALAGYLENGQLEAAVLMARRSRIPLDETIFSPIMKKLDAEMSIAKQNNHVGDSRKLSRLKYALTAFRIYGPVPEKMIMETDVSDGYAGKILLVSISGEMMEEMVCLRSGDSWHREILRNTEKEMSDLGFYSTRVYPLGGAYLGFDRDGDLLIWGASDDYGSCDKRLASNILAGAFPGKKINVYSK